ncbi:hypothetical protein GRI39_03345 [Altererythrobacter indicus]|uniref:Uncharacterized protein n=1 Tax=Altericroceibacterium indicum TaxID=374177 RepID=A0A845A7R5_9SPHN|nr:hypothetical protein [Altericroceibacterium indicum]MXP25081.1 hypothetical protein [Altericroceibacterium indicum]
MAIRQDNMLALYCSVFFTPGKRPSFDAIWRMCEDSGNTIELRSATVGRTSLSYAGFQFELNGLSPGRPAFVPRETRNARIGVEFRSGEFESVELSLWVAKNVEFRLANPVRALTHVAAELSELPDARAVQWNRSKNLCQTERFRNAIRKWPKRDALPSEGLISICRMPDGGLQTDGLHLFSGQEVRLEPEVAEAVTESHQIALSIAQRFAREGALAAPMRIKNPFGGHLRIEPSENKRFIRVWVDVVPRPFGVTSEYRRNSGRHKGTQKWSITQWVPPSLI